MFKYLKFIIALTLISYGPSSNASNYTVFGGIHRDSLNGNNINVSFAYKPKYLNPETNSKEPTVRLFYLDAETGQYGKKLTAGYGIGGCCVGMLRGGLSYAEIENNKLIGFQGTAMALYAELRAGIYWDMTNNREIWMLGFGIGIY